MQAQFSRAKVTTEDLDGGQHRAAFFAGIGPHPAASSTATSPGAAWEDVTVDEVAQRIERWQAAFRREGFAPGERIALCARNGVNWVAIDQAALGLGLVVVPLYVDDNPESVAWCVDHAKARLLDRRELAHCREPVESR